MPAAPQPDALFDISDASKRQLLKRLGLLDALQRKDLPLERWLQCARVHCLSKVGSGGLNAGHATR